MVGAKIPFLLPPTLGPTEQAMLEFQKQLQEDLLMKGHDYGRYWQTNPADYGRSIGPSGGSAGSSALTYAHLARQYARFSVLAEPKREPVENAGIRAGEITAWRCWRLNKGFLQSAHVETVWAPGEVMEGTVPDHGVEGVNAWKTKSGALTYGVGVCDIIGSVLLWGEVVEHEKGYRAQYAKIASIDDVIGEVKLDWAVQPGWPRRKRMETRREAKSRVLAELRERYGGDIGSTSQEG